MKGKGKALFVNYDITRQFWPFETKGSSDSEKTKYYYKDNQKSAEFHKEIIHKSVV